MSSASVGFHCPSCVREGSQRVIRPRDLANRRPPVTTALIAVTVIGSLLARLPGRLAAEAALFGPAVTDGEFWRIATSGFVHLGLFHLITTMAVLWLVGQEVESTLGPVATAAVYGAGLLGGAAAVLVFDPNAVHLGATGPVLALVAAAALLTARRGGSLAQTPAIGVAGLSVLLGVLAPSVSIWSYAGGLVAGLSAAWLALQVRRRPVGGRSR